MSIAQLKEYCTSHNIDISGIGTSSGFEDKNILLSRIKDYHILNRESSKINYPKLALIITMMGLFLTFLFNIYGTKWLEAIYEFIFR
jgi:hypothetical protein